MPHPRSLPLREQAARLAALVENAGLGVRRGAAECFSTGCPALDRLLPGGGLARGSLVEWLADEPGGGAAIFATVAAREAQRDSGAVIVIDRDAGFYPPAAAAWGLDLASTIVVHPANDADQRWAIDQALRCPHVAAVLAWPRRLDGRTFRRLQLAAEASGAVGLLVRPAAARREPSWAQIRWAVAPRPASREAAGEQWQLALRLLRVRGNSSFVDVRNDEGVPLLARPAVRPGYPASTAGQASSGALSLEVVVEIDPVTGAIHEARLGHLAAELARPTGRAEQA